MELTLAEGTCTPQVLGCLVVKKKYSTYVAEEVGKQSVVSFSHKVGFGTPAVVLRSARGRDRPCYSGEGQAHRFAGVAAATPAAAHQSLRLSSGTSAGAT